MISVCKERRWSQNEAIKGHFSFGYSVFIARRALFLCQNAPDAQAPRNYFLIRLTSHFLVDTIIVGIEAQMLCPTAYIEYKQD